MLMASFMIDIARPCISKSDIVALSHICFAEIVIVINCSAGLGIIDD